MIITDAFRQQVSRVGRTFRIRYFTEVIGSVWDDDRTLTASGVDFIFLG